ncbi:uncharacterized protein BO66DRAFT_77483 [Aspergillus aculeatinus CBS 121060]|uniref:Uncharacterized protein n=1 Tax=Aspergillus aculeatinus CBS 121060 TaxID=1448322 RepID=A0ACD1HB64_9EURO|nr:hypothetical protein BO66DRAFT_77483 [Aspergillus aculeatinus CBS 121060]RAH70644.1 hypothetical protein BO66DRAFT_77483 [Aspergillus aculeatinus CBS 121060]
MFIAVVWVTWVPIGPVCSRRLREAAADWLRNMMQTIVALGARLILCAMQASMDFKDLCWPLCGYIMDRLIDDGLLLTPRLWSAVESGGERCTGRRSMQTMQEQETCLLPVLTIGSLFSLYLYHWVVSTIWPSHTKAEELNAGLLAFGVRMDSGGICIHSCKSQLSLQAGERHISTDNCPAQSLIVR